MHKAIAQISILEKSDSGGRITISTPAVDRDRDRIIPTGGQVDNYLKNPVVQWGHNYREPWATVGRTTLLEVSPDGISVEFELRPAANEADPQNIVRLLWAGNWVRTASIGFRPNIDKAIANAQGGYDFHEWELLEWSLVPIPANQEALRNSLKALGLEIPQTKIYIPNGSTTGGTGTTFVLKEGEPAEPPQPAPIDPALLTAIAEFLQSIREQLGAKP